MALGLQMLFKEYVLINIKILYYLEVLKTFEIVLYSCMTFGKMFKDPFTVFF